MGYMVLMALSLLILGFIWGIFFSASAYRLYLRAERAHPLPNYLKEIQNRPDFVPLRDISPFFLLAVILAEDRRFFSHQGISIARILQSAWLNFRRRRIITGGSSISQQLAKNLYFSFKKTYQRKIAELFVVRRLEKTFGKEIILSTYLNIIYFGNEQYGIGAATKYYFQCTPSELSIDQSLALATLLPAPIYRNPIAQPTLSLHFANRLRLWMEAIHLLPKMPFNETIVLENAMQVYQSLLKKRQALPCPLTALKQLEKSSLIDLSRIRLVNHVNALLTIPTCYCFGGEGEPLTYERLRHLIRKWPHYYTFHRLREYLFLLHSNQTYYGYDCSGLIRSLWGGIDVHPECDFNTSMMLARAMTKGEIATFPYELGLCLWCPGHIGVYVGNGEVVEATPNKMFGHGVVKTYLKDRQWTHWLDVFSIASCAQAMKMR